MSNHSKNTFKNPIAPGTMNAPDIFRSDLGTTNRSNGTGFIKEEDMGWLSLYEAIWSRAILDEMKNAKIELGLINEQGGRLKEGELSEELILKIKQIVYKETLDYPKNHLTPYDYKTMNEDIERRRNKSQNKNM